MPNVFGLTSFTAEPASGLVGASTMSAGILLRQDVSPVSDAILWGNWAANVGWGIRLQADASAPQTQLFNILNNANAQAAGRAGTTAPDVFAIPGMTLISFTLTGGTLTAYINGQLVSSAAGEVTANGVPTLQSGGAGNIIDAFYTETNIAAVGHQALAITAARCGTIYGGLNYFVPNTVSALSIQHAYAAVQGQRRPSTTWEDVGTLANRPLTVAGDPTIFRSLFPDSVMM